VDLKTRQIFGEMVMGKQQYRKPGTSVVGFIAYDE